MDQRIIEEKIESLRRCVRRIETKRPGRVEVLQDDWDLQDIIALNMTWAVQRCVDIAAHVVAASDQAPPETMGEAFENLHEMGVLGRDLSERLKQLDKYLQILQSMQSYSGKEFRGEPEHYRATERFLHLATKAINDMVSHVIAEEQWGSVDQYSDLSRLFGSEGYIDDAQRDQWIRMIGFRNVLVHDYLDVDREIVYTVPQEDLDDLDQLKRLFAKFL